MSEAFDAVEIIGAKRDKNELSDPQIDWVIDAYTKGVVADEQRSALLMASKKLPASKEESVLLESSQFSTEVAA